MTSEISVGHRTVLHLTVNRLMETSAPTGLGFNDMAVMIAYGQSDEYGIPTVNASMISNFLKSGHMAVPADAEIEPQTVQSYLDILCRYRLIDEEGGAGNYRMRDDTSKVLVDGTDMLKSPHIDEFLFHGFRIYCARQMHEASQPHELPEVDVKAYLRAILEKPL